MGALDARRVGFARLSSHLSHLDDRQLRSALKSSASHVGPWGSTYSAEVDGSKVFVKRIPLTELEASRPWSTRNHFRLPTYYNYGVGSAGFGAFRELVAHVTTTAWVIEGVSSNFPMLLHHRVMGRTGARELEEERIEEYRRRWNGSRPVAEFLRARASAQHEIWLVSEHVPYVMDEWLMGNQERVGEVIVQLFAAISLMRRRGAVHFDAHFGNVLTDGKTVYLADFGLLNDANFDLTKPERDFLARHEHYDYAETVFSVGLAPMWSLWRRSEKSRTKVLGRYDWLKGRHNQREFAAALIDNLDKMTDGPLAIAPLYAAELRRYREVILYMAAFLDAMRPNPRKNTPYDDDHVRRLLEEAGAPIE